MKIAFVTTQSAEQSTLVGRVLPLASELSKKGNEVHVLLHESKNSDLSGIKTHIVGQNPFTIDDGEKKRAKGVKLLWIMFKNAIRTSRALKNIQPDTVVIVKPLPQNVLAVWLWCLRGGKSKIVLDTDDFELTANALRSIYQRAFIHWSERKASQLAHVIIAATPFLEDHFRQLTANKKPTHVVPNGLTFTYKKKNVSHSPTLTYIGSVSQSSGHNVNLLPDILTSILKQFSDARLVIAGTGHDEDSLKDLFTSRGLNNHVDWYGRFSSAEVSSILDKTDVLIDPIDTSITNRAKSSFRVALAIAAGKPVVTSNVGIRTELIPAPLHEICFATPANASSYANKVIDLLKNPLTPDQETLLKNHARAYTWESLAKAYTTYIAS